MIVKYIYSDYPHFMKYSFLFPLLFILAFTSCQNDDGPVCTSCTSATTPPFELCRESDGTASVNGENTGVSYDTYLEGLSSEGVECE